jgi:hypothetical protein
MAESQRKAKQRGTDDTTEFGTQQKKTAATTELVLTVAMPTGEIVKVEKLDKSGRRNQISEKEIEALAGGDVLDDLGDVLEEAYVAGISDAIEDDLLETDGENDERESLIQSYIFRRSIGRSQLRRHARQLILRQALLREVAPEKKRPERGGVIRKKLRDASGPGETKH